MIRRKPQNQFLQGLKPTQAGWEAWTFLASGTHNWADTVQGVNESESCPHT